MNQPTPLEGIRAGIETALNECQDSKLDFEAVDIISKALLGALANVRTLEEQGPEGDYR